MHTLGSPLPPPPHFLFSSQGPLCFPPAGHLQELPEVVTDISTLSFTGRLGFSDLYLGTQSGENRNVGRKWTGKNKGINRNIRVSFKFFSLITYFHCMGMTTAIYFGGKIEKNAYHLIHIHNQCDIWANYFHIFSPWINKCFWNKT